MAITYSKTSNINIRISKDDKKALEKAAEINHLSLSSYIVSTCLKQAEYDLMENKVLHLNKAQMDYIIDLLKNPKEPSQELINLFK